MNKVQQIVSTHKSLFIFGGVLAAGIWFGVIGKSMVDTNKKTAPANPGVIAVQSHTSSATLPTTDKSRRTIIPMHATQHTTAVATNTHHSLPEAKMTSTSARLHETSGATTHTIGSGIATTSGNVTIANKSSIGMNQGISYGGNMLALSSSLALAAPGASHANEMAEVVTSAENPSRPRRVNEDPLDPFLDPVGDVPFAVMALLTIAWCVRVRLRRRSACSTDK